MTTKLPEPRDWWVSNDGSEIAYICGFDHEGDPVFQTDDVSNARIFPMDVFLAEYHHEPLCTGFDWQPASPIDPGEGWELVPKGTMLEDGDEFSVDRGKTWVLTGNGGKDRVRDTAYRRRKPVETWPKYYDVIYPERAYIKRLSETQYVVVNTDGTASSEYRWHYRLLGGRKEITKDEAMNNRIRSLDPSIPAAADIPEAPPVTAAIESPDDWVTQDRVPARNGIDQRRYIYSGDPGGWDDASQIDWPDRSLVVHGADCGDDTILELRCRRRDLPPLPATQPSRIPVRLWVYKDTGNGHGYNIFTQFGEPDQRHLYAEIKIGPDGFYVEGGE